jgi:hypothetical protein
MSGCIVCRIHYVFNSTPQIAGSKGASIPICKFVSRHQLSQAVVSEVNKLSLPAGLRQDLFWYVPLSLRSSWASSVFDVERREHKLAHCHGIFG